MQGNRQLTQEKNRQTDNMGGEQGGVVENKVVADVGTREVE